MAFSSQIFTAPKIGKGNISSPLSSGASKISKATPKLRVNRINFGNRRIVRSPALESQSPVVNSSAIKSQSSIESTLSETNKILVDIQKQLALNFSMRIADEKEKNIPEEIEEISENIPKAEPEPEPQQESRGLFSLFASAISPDEPEESNEPELDEPEFIAENDPLPKIELSDEVVEASESVSDEQLEEAGISRDDFEIGLQDMVDNPDDYMMDIEEVDSDIFEDVVQVDETIFNEQIEDEIEEEIQEDETIDWREIFGPSYGTDFGETDATPI